MSAVSPATIRQRAAAAIEALSGWSEVPVAWELYTLRELPEMEHQGFAVGIPSTSPMQDDRRQRPAGVLSRTEVAVRFAYVLRHEGHVVDTDGAVAAELEVAAAVRGMTSTDCDPPRFVRVDRTTSTTDSTAVRIVDMRWSVLHLYALT